MTHKRPGCFGGHPSTSLSGRICGSRRSPDSGAILASTAVIRARSDEAADLHGVEERGDDRPTDHGLGAGLLEARAVSPARAGVLHQRPASLARSTLQPLELRGLASDDDIHGLRGPLVEGIVGLLRESFGFAVGS